MDRRRGERLDDFLPIKRCGSANHQRKVDTETQHPSKSAVYSVRVVSRANRKNLMRNENGKKLLHSRQPSTETKNKNNNSQNMGWDGKPIFIVVKSLRFTGMFALKQPHPGNLTG